MQGKIKNIIREGTIEEIKNEESPKKGKRKARSASPSVENIAKKRFIKDPLIEHSYQTITFSTKFIIPKRPCVLNFKLQPGQKINLEDKKYVYYLGPVDFEVEFEKINTPSKKKEKSYSLTLKEKKRLQILQMLSNEKTTYREIADNLNMKRQNVRNIILNYEKTGELFGSKKGRKPKLNQDHLKFVLDLLERKENIGINLIGITNKIIDKFKLKKNAISPYSVYRLLKANKIVFKKLIWKKPKDNEERTKNMRKELSEIMLRVYISDLWPIYIDEASFNLEIRRNYTWTKKGKVMSAIRPPKSTNYSLLAAMDLKRIVGWMVFRGSVKKEDYFSFLMSLNKIFSQTQFKSLNPIFFMDNAKIHKSELYMIKIFNNYYTTIYNAPYSPQLNPIEYCFSQIKSNVSKCQYQLSRSF